eukprot:MONOS_9621.1-p1 / transcript=MONOS_9621.1 / gene=MONOS_9621 / organism=Monocercomonoides_exilis_PA203 / gene_product=unspecified product / transcript_product=unspecified product / location=Mono_scaffold00403:21445-22596(+) / protein_length=293 / sequence_SO=supercontig / SO=protein_coding / is_pseudo=false
MIIDEYAEKEEKSEKLLTDLCECYLTLGDDLSSELLSICVPCLLKVALNIEENEKAQKEVEIALLALSNISKFYEIKKELYLNEIREILKYHQEHRNLTQIAYHSAWQFLICRLFYDRSLEDIILNELHLVREATRELEELSKYIDWKREEEEGRKEETEAKEMIIVRKWLFAIQDCFSFCKMWNEEFIGLFSCITWVFRTAKENYKEISKKCIYLFVVVLRKEAVKAEDLLNCGIVDAVLEEIHQPILNDDIACYCLKFFITIARRLNGQDEGKMEEEERKIMKRKMKQIV